MISCFESWFLDIVLKDLVHKNLLLKQNVFGFPRIDTIILTTSLKTSFMKNFGPLPALVVLLLLTGKKGVLCRAKKSIANWGVRKHIPLGCKVVLRKHECYLFLEELVLTVFSRGNSFGGVSINNSGSVISFGLKNIYLFPRLQGCESLWNGLCVNKDNKQDFLGLNVTIILESDFLISKSFFLSCFQIPTI